MINTFDAAELQAIGEFMEVYPRHSARSAIEALAEIYDMEPVTMSLILELKQEAQNNPKKHLSCN